MVEIELDGKKVEVQEGSMVMHAAEKAGTFIPHFCYHKKLSIAANCRMCLVDVEKAPKPMPACATPVTQGMIVRTHTDKAVKAQKSVMEFLLINHPLDCPICDQGGECQLQDLAVGYGGSASRYDEEKRVVFHKDVGPLISMEEMSRCIHCTRCVRFGQEIAGVMELGMSHRGEHSEIETFVGATVDSELSGNMIDICPVGALTSKPFRYSARTWELSRRKSVSPHDATGANLIVQVKNHRVMRVVPMENESVNECWIADRDRFSYEALNGDDRLTQPMLKQGGEWKTVDWTTALEYVANGLKQVKTEHGAHAIGTLASPHSTAEELFLAASLMRGLGSGNIDARLRAADFHHEGGVRWLGTSIASLTELQRALVIGGNPRKDQPLLGQRLRQAARRGAHILSLNEQRVDWAMPVHTVYQASASVWVQALADVAAAVAQAKGVLPLVVGNATQPQALAIAQSLLSGERKAVLLGNAAANHPQASGLLALANWIGQHTGASVGFLGEAANTVGAQLVGALPSNGGLNVAQMSQAGALKAVLLLNTDPHADSAHGAEGVATSDMVVTLSPFKTNLDISDVLLPIATRRMSVDTTRISDLESRFTAKREGDDHYRYSVAWIDHVGMGCR
ncbi:MAG: NADH-quinone oxidoreductase chain 3, partial [Pseudomonadota bacterium]